MPTARTRFFRPLFLLAALSLLLDPCAAAAATQPKQIRPRDYRVLGKSSGKLEGASTPKPGYPFEFRRAYAQVSAALRVFVNENGGIDGVEVAAAAGDRGLANYAAKFGKENWKFPRRTVNGKPVKYQWIVPVTYIYNGGYEKLNAAIRELNSPLVQPVAKDPFWP